MAIEQTLQAVGMHLHRLEQNLAKLREQSLNNDQIAAPPRIYLRGYYESFDPLDQTLQIQISGSTEHYPLSCYNGAWLPMPRQQVVITRTHGFAPARSAMDFDGAEDADRRARERGAPQITAFAAHGKAIPEAPRVRYSVEGYSPREGQLRLRDTAAQVQFLKMPEEFARYYNPDIRNGQTMEFRIVRVPPKRYFIPLLSDATDGQRPSAYAFLQQIGAATP